MIRKYLLLDLLESSLFFCVFLIASNKLYCLCLFLAESNFNGEGRLERSFFIFETYAKIED